MDIIEDVEKWFLERPAWFQEAAKRFIENGEIKDADFKDLVAICKSEVFHSQFPVIFPRKNFKLGTVLNSIQRTLDFFCDKPDRLKKKIQFLKAILRDFKENILNWKLFKPKRSLIEDVIKVMKKTFSLDKIHRYTLPSVTKQASIAVLLAGVSISMGFRDKKQLQRLAEW